MGRYGACDFVVKYDPENDKDEDIVKSILYTIIVKRLKSKKPAVCFISADSGEGKSYASLRLQELLCEIQGIDAKEYLDIMNVYTPLQYPKKLEALLFDKQYKKANIICMHEAREVVKANKWQSFINTAISDVNAMSRTIKRMCVIIISQFIKDIDTKIRYTLNYYMKVSRPLGRRSRLQIFVMWKDDRNLEQPILRKRKLAGYLVLPNGKYRRYIPDHFELNKPSQEIRDLFEKADYEAKALILKDKMEKLVKEMEDELGVKDQNKKVDTMVDWYTKNLENLTLIGTKNKNGWRVKPDFKQMHDLTKLEVNMFEKKLNTKLVDMGIIENDA